MKRVVALLPVLIAFQAGAPPALAWTWPADGPVLRPFILGDDPYAGGQHRGVDIAGEQGAPVRSPAAGVVSFSGTVPGGGRTVTVQTADGYSVTLVHLGSIAVERAADVGEGTQVGTIGPTGDAEHPEPYLHLGIRVTSDVNGYLNPLDFLPAHDSLPTAPPTPPAAEPVPAAPPAVVPSAPQPVSEPPPSAEVPASTPEAPPAPAAPEPVRAQQARASFEHRADVAVPAHPSARMVARPARASLERAGRGQPDDSRTTPSPSRQTRFGSFEVPGSAPGLRLDPEAELPLARSAADDHFGVAPAAFATVVALLALVAGSALRFRQLSRARAADASTPVLDDRAGRATEDTGAARPAQEDRLILDRDFEGVPLGQPEALSDLDRDHDPAELVEVANDACRRLPTTVAPSRIHRVGRRPSSRCRRAEIVSTR